RYGYCYGNCREAEDAPIFSGTDDGWNWIARLGPRHYAWTALRFDGAPPSIPESVRGLRPAGPVRGADVTWRIVSACAGPGYFITGDAASVMDPAASHGVIKALMSGILAADLAARVAEGNTTEAVAAQAFDAWTRQWHSADTERLTTLYGASFMAPTGAGAGSLTGMQSALFARPV